MDQSNYKENCGKKWEKKTPKRVDILLSDDF